MSWEAGFRKRVRNVGQGSKAYLTVIENHGGMNLRYRPSEGKSITKSIPFKWNELESDDAYIRIRNIYKLMLEGVEFSLAVDIADDKAPMPDEDRDWKKALEEYKVAKLSRGTGVKESTWTKEHEPVIKDAIALMSGRRSPDNPAELIDKTTEDWEIGSRTRQQRARNLASFLRYCVTIQKFPDRWNPPADLSYHIGRKPASSKSQKVDPLPDQDIIDLIDAFENFDGSIRNRPAALNWSRAIKLMAAFGLRPIELKYLEKRVDRKTKKKYLWCSYEKRSGGGITKPRRLYPLYPIGKKGVKQDWNLVELFDQKAFVLPPLENKNGVGEACIKYLDRQNAWQKIRKNAEDRNERAGSYSFRHSYSVRGHELNINGGSMALAMGHSYETHCREYPWASESGTTAEFERVGST
jgi:integrase